jgi:general secretion pathway protein L
MMSELKELFAVWIAAVSAAIHAMATRIVPQRHILLTEGEPNHFTARVISARKEPALPSMQFQIADGRPEPALTADWQAALRGSRIEITMQPDHVFFRAVDFPKQAADFLDGMVRAQIDRLTPWTAGETLFGLTAPTPIANDRIAVTLAATSRQKVQPLINLAADCGAASVVGQVQATNNQAGDAPASEIEALGEPIRLFDKPLSGAAGSAIDVARLLRMTLLGTGLAAAACLLVSAYLGGEFAAEQQELQQKIAQRRTALRLDHSDGSAETLLAKRKQTSPSSVMVLEAISRALPDTTYVTELRIEGDKMQVVGLTQDAPSLIKLLEQSPQFARAIFFAPTTRGQNDPGERFHIEAHIIPYFGSGS